MRTVSLCFQNRKYNTEPLLLDSWNLDFTRKPGVYSETCSLCIWKPRVYLETWSLFGNLEFIWKPGVYLKTGSLFRTWNFNINLKACVILKCLGLVKLPVGQTPGWSNSWLVNVMNLFYCMSKDIVSGSQGGYKFKNSVVSNSYLWKYTIFLVVFQPPIELIDNMDKPLPSEKDSI